MRARGILFKPVKYNVHTRRGRSDASRNSRRVITVLRRGAYELTHQECLLYCRCGGCYRCTGNRITLWCPPATPPRLVIRKIVRQCYTGCRKFAGAPRDSWDVRDGERERERDAPPEFFIDNPDSTSSNIFRVQSVEISWREISRIATQSAVADSAGNFISDFFLAGVTATSITYYANPARFAKEATARRWIGSAPTCTPYINSRAFQPVIPHACNALRHRA